MAGKMGTVAVDNQIRHAALRLRTATTAGVLTGAGVSAASGIPTFRGDQGLWKMWRPEDLATPAAFEADPALVWEWYAWRRELIADCRPNRAHEVLARWSTRFRGFTLITQNVDGLHERAGTESVVRYHGSIWDLECFAGCGTKFEDRRVPLPTMPPRCEQCGALLRPGVVWFGEPIPIRAVESAERAARSDVFLSIGTSALVYPAAGLVTAARRHGAFTIEINPEPTPLSGQVDIAIHGPAEEVLDEIETRLQANEEEAQ